MNESIAYDTIAILAGVWCTVGMPIFVFRGGKIVHVPPPPPPPDIVAAILGGIGGAVAWLALGPAVGSGAGILGCAVIGVLGGTLLAGIGAMVMGSRDRPVG